MILSDLTNDQLLRDTQRMVDAHRRFLDECMRQIANSDEFDISRCDGHSNKPMAFTGRLKAMVDECTGRGLDLNTDR